MIFHDINKIILKFSKHRPNRLTMKALKKNWVVEIYDDAALDEGNQQGQYSLIREAGTNKVNTIGWKSKMSDRRAWSSLAAEAQAMQGALDKAIHWQSLKTEMNLPIKHITVLTDNLSLRRVVYSGRPTQEQSLRREVAIIRDMIIYNNIRVRFVKSEVMLADHLTKERSASQIYEVLKTNTFNRINKYDNGDITTNMIRDAAIDIPLKHLEKILTVEVELINDQITSIQREGGQQQHQEDSSHQARRPNSGRKSTLAEDDARAEAE